MNAQRKRPPTPAAHPDSRMWGAQLDALYAPVRLGLEDIESELAAIRESIEAESNGLTLHLQTFSTQGL